MSDNNEATPWNGVMAGAPANQDKSSPDVATLIGGVIGGGIAYAIGLRDGKREPKKEAKNGR